MNRDCFYGPATSMSSESLHGPILDLRPGPNHQEAIMNMKKKFLANIIRSSVFWGTLWLFIGVPLWMTTQADPAPKIKEDSLNLAYTHNTESRAIPPIDAAAPSAFETASFGLG